MRRRVLIRGALGLVLALVAKVSPGTEVDDPPSPAVESGLFPSAPAKSAGALRVTPGFETTLFAAEPDLASPVAMAFDADGDVYVAEMLDYPIIRTPGMFGPFPEGQVRLLRTDEDGKIVGSTVFALALPAPTSVLPYDGGVLVAAAPDVLFLKDTDGDGHADVREVVLTGFDTSQDLYRVNSLIWGIDGWIYARGVGDTPIHWGDDLDGPPLSTAGMDFRFRPRERQFEAVSGMSGCFGLAVDDWGHRFFSNSANHIYQIVLPDRYLGRNPDLAAPPSYLEISDHGGVAQIHRVSPPQPWRVERSNFWEAAGLNAKYFGKIEPRQDYMTAVCGPLIYREASFPTSYRGNYFVCEAVGNLVHRDVLEGPGPVYKAVRGEVGREFLASADNWTSPVNLAAGPDGAIYVVDMYRQIIEHAGPDGGRDVPNVPVEVLKKYGLRAGSTMGRIYRVQAVGNPKILELLGSESRLDFWKPDLEDANPGALRLLLEAPGSWVRSTAQRLILERPATADLPGITRVASQEHRPEARVQALWTLQALGRLTSETVRRALDDPTPGVRENALQMAEPSLGVDERLTNSVLKMTSDPDPTVRFQLALSLGELQAPARLDALAELARRDGGATYPRAAILTALRGDGEALFRKLADGPAFSSAEAMLTELSEVIGAGLDPVPIGSIVAEADRLNAGGRNAEAAAVLRGMARGIERRRLRAIRVPAARDPLDRLLAAKSSDVRAAADALKPLLRTLTDAERRQAFERASATVIDDAKSLQDRLQAIVELGEGDPEDAIPALARLLHPREPEALQAAALDRLDTLPGPAVAEAIAEAWKGLSPDLRARSLKIAVARADRLLPLLEAIRRDLVPASALDEAQRARLLGAREPSTAMAALEVLGDADAPRDDSRFDRLRAALETAGDPRRGETIFRSKCLTCHRLGSEGIEIGPDLASVRDRPRVQVLRDVLDPNLTIQPQYLQATIETTDGQILNGLVAFPGSTSFTLKRPDEPDLTILRKDVEAMTTSGTSVMPIGLLDDLGAQDVADLLEFVKRIEPVNTPRTDPH